MSEQEHTIEDRRETRKQGNRQGCGPTKPLPGAIRPPETIDINQPHRGAAGDGHLASALATGHFDFEGHAVRTIGQGPDIWFVLADVCRAMKLAAHKGTYSSHITKLDADEIKQVSRDAILDATPGLNPGVGTVECEGSARLGAKLADANDPLALEKGPTAWLISESGLYTMMLRSRRATTPGTLAHRFRRWVTGEVLPSIRHTGAYRANTAEQPEIKQLDWTVSIPGPGRYVVNARSGDDVKIHQTEYTETMAELTAVDCRIMACTCLQIASFWRKVQELRAIGIDPAGGFALQQIDRAILSGADLGRRYFYIYDKPDPPSPDDLGSSSAPFAG